ncbi:MAG: prolyl oligopeptidase family serine peptidase [Bacteroidota bacterium]
MFKILFPTLFLFGLSGFLFAQQEIVFSIKDTELGSPIQGVFFEYDTTQVGVSDRNGLFNIKIDESDALLRLSHLSYRDTLFSVSDIPSDTLIVLLKPRSVLLPEISVTNRKRKFRSPAQLLKMALRAIPDNYIQAESYPIGLYRETVTHNDCPVSLTEGVFEYRLSSYKKKHAHRKAWSAAWERYYSSYPYPFNGRLKAFAFDHAEGTQLYAAVDDAYRPIQIRYSQLRAPMEGYAVFRDGPLDLIALDKVRLAYDFLSRADMKQYDYLLVDSVFVNNSYCYHLQFKPADNKPTKYHALPQTPKTAAFSGDIYISIDRLAIVRYEASNSKPVVRNNGLVGYRIAPENSLHMRADYAKNEDEKWSLRYAQCSTTSIVDSAYQAMRTLHLVPTSNIKARDEQRWYSSNYLNHLHNLSQGYDRTFWAAFEQSSIYKSTDEIALEACIDQASNFIFSQNDQQVVSTPKASPRGNLGYVRPGQQRRNDWKWLESPSDSATTSYLRWENDYYAQYFRDQRDNLDEVAQQFSSTIQGIPRDPTPTVFPDTVFLNDGNNLGFFQRDSESEQTLIFSVPDPEPGYAITYYGWIEAANLYYTTTENLAYDRQLTIYQADSKAHTIHYVDDYEWQGDTLYAITNNERLRTASLSRWTKDDGWIVQKEEPRPDFEHRFQTLPNGQLIVITESMTNATILRLNNEAWVEEEKVIPALLAGSGPDGYGCDLNIEADFILDCRRLGNEQCAIAVKDGRQYLYARQNDEEEWKKVNTPDFATIFSFDDSNSEQIILNIEGVGNYGRLASLDLPDIRRQAGSRRSELKLLPEKSLTISLEGYADSIVFATAADGTRIPCQMRWRRDKVNELKSTFLKIYGAYGNPYFVGHDEADIAMMNLGFAVVYVHTRGGGMRGPDWHDAGRAENKITACTDYVDALKHFKSNHPLMPTPLTGYAQSAGGPILGYAVNEYPELLTAAVFDHAFLDVVNVMKDPTLPLTQYEYPEWGDPSNRSIRRIQESYSPFQNIKTQTYPALLFIGGLYDKSTPYWQIAKYVAALRRANTEKPNTILLRTNLKGSHPGTPFGPRMDQYFEQIAFLLEESE